MNMNSLTNIVSANICVKYLRLSARINCHLQRVIPNAMNVYLILKEKSESQN